jgi:pyruvate/2-oxoacid:ferredoxin oxidoreductase alpha subunit
MADESEDWACVDGNEACSRVAYFLSETAFIYPITPSSPMGEVRNRAIRPRKQRATTMSNYEGGRLGSR